MTTKTRYALFTYPTGVTGWWTFRTRQLAEYAIKHGFQPFYKENPVKFTGEILTETQMGKRGFFKDGEE